MVDYFKNIGEGIWWAIQVVAGAYWMITPPLGWLIFGFLMLLLPIWLPVVVWYIFDHILSESHTPLSNDRLRPWFYVGLGLTGIALQSLSLLIGSLIPPSWDDALGCMFCSILLAVVIAYKIPPIHRWALRLERRYL